MKYYVKVFRPEDNTILIEAAEKQKIPIPEAYYKFNNIWDALYVIDIENKLIKRVTDYYEIKSLIHTGIRVIWADDFARELETNVKHERVWGKCSGKTALSHMRDLQRTVDLTVQEQLIIRTVQYFKQVYLEKKGCLWVRNIMITGSCGLTDEVVN